LKLANHLYVGSDFYLCNRASAVFAPLGQKLNTPGPSCSFLGHPASLQEPFVGLRPLSPAVSERIPIDRWLTADSAVVSRIKVSFGAKYGPRCSGKLRSLFLQRRVTLARTEVRGYAGQPAGQQVTTW
jgi:hypothetical protein